MGRISTELRGNDGSAWTRPLGVAALVLALVFAAGVGSSRSLAHVGGPSRLLSSRSVGGDLAVVGLVIVGAGIAAIAFAATRLRRRRRSDEPEIIVEWENDGRWLAWLAILALVLAVAGIITAVSLFSHSAQTRASRAVPAIPSVGGNPRPSAPSAVPGSSVPSVDWWEVAIVATLLVGGVGVTWSLSRRRRSNFGDDPAKTGELHAALDRSLEDVEREPDPRRAVIKAYGRMEAALGSGGIARRSFETPLEYLARSLVSLRVSRGAANRLASLFELAKFSQHDVDISMKHDALEALTSVRDELQGADR